MLCILVDVISDRELFSIIDFVATVELRGPVEYANASVYHPAAFTPLDLGAPTTSAAITTLVVPLSSGDPTGCAVVRLTPKETVDSSPA